MLKQKRKIIVNSFLLAGLFVYFFSAANFTLAAEQGPQALCDQATQTADIDENGRITCKIKNPSPTHLVNIDNFGTLLVNVISLLLKFAGAIAVLFLVIGGFQYISARGNEEASEKAKKTISGAIIGIVIIVMAYAVVAIVNDILVKDLSN